MKRTGDFTEIERRIPVPFEDVARFVDAMASDEEAWRFGHPLEAQLSFIMNAEVWYKESITQCVFLKKSCEQLVKFEKKWRRG